MHNEKILARLESLREVMRRESLDAFVFPSTDAHQSEYVASHWKAIEWLSGFTGEAGTLVVTQRSAALWTDSRFFIAATQQLAGTGISLMKLKIKGTPTIAEWLGEELKDASSPQVGLDGMVNARSFVDGFIEELRHQGGITLRTNFDPLRDIWTSRPAIPESPVMLHPLKYAGETTESKLARIRKSLRSLHADGMLVSNLADIAWTLNLRGTDVECNPVFVAYLLIAPDKVTLYINKVKLTDDVIAYLAANNIVTDDYERVGEGLKNYFAYNILMDPDETCYSLATTKMNYAKQIISHTSPIPELKDVKNPTEIDGFHAAMLRDGVALVRFLRWLKPAVKAGGVTEITVADKIESLRREQPLYRGVSFATIAGYEEHGAIVHYEATPDTDVELQPRGFVLVDTGAQYLDGTTDVTRTIPLGPITDEQRHIYTLVLKAHIQLELCKFPDGAVGTQIDAVAREPLWREGLNFLHGTGHGVGSYLNVHEGPHQIRMEYIPTPMHAGMTVTDEPGIYLEGRFGVRIENTLLIRDYTTTPLGHFLQMEPLTLCPIDLEPIDRALLTPEERQWLNGYHRLVRQKLSPFLNADEQSWLEENTRQLI